MMSKLVTVIGHRCNPKPWEPNGSVNLSATGLLAESGSGLVVVVPCLPWILCSEIIVSTNTHKVQVKVAVQCETNSLCVLAATDYNTINPIDLGNPRSHNKRSKTLSRGGNKIRTLLADVPCTYLGRSDAELIRDIYEPSLEVRVGDCAYHNKTFVGMVVKNERQMLVVPREFINRIIMDYESKSTGIGTIGLKYFTAHGKLEVKQPQVLEYHGDMTIIYGTIEAVNGVPIMMNDLEQPYVYDDRYKADLPFGLWFQLRHRPGDEGTIKVDGVIIPFVAKRLVGPNKKVNYLDAYKPCHNMIWKKLDENHVVVMPYRCLVDLWVATSQNYSVFVKGKKINVVWLLEGENAFQLVKVNDEWIDSLEQIPNRCHSIQYFDGNAIVFAKID